MKNGCFRHYVSISLLVLSLVWLTGCADLSTVTSTMVQELDLAGANVIDLATDNGQVQIAPHSGSNLQVTVTCSAAASTTAAAQELLQSLSVIMQRQGEKAVVHVSIPPMHLGEGAKADILVLVPESWSGETTVYTANGRINVSGGNTVATGTGVFETANGRIIIRNWVGAVTATSGNGQIIVEDSLFTAQSNIQSGNGDLSLALAGLMAKFSAATGNGDIYVEMPRTIRASITSTIGNGSLRLAGAFGNSEYKGTQTIWINGGGVPVGLRSGNGTIIVTGI